MMLEIYHLTSAYRSRKLGSNKNVEPISHNCYAQRFPRGWQAPSLEGVLTSGCPCMQDKIKHECMLQAHKIFAPLCKMTGWFQFVSSASSSKLQAHSSLCRLLIPLQDSILGFLPWILQRHTLSQSYHTLWPMYIIMGLEEILHPTLSQLSLCQSHRVPVNEGSNLLTIKGQ